MINIRVKVKMWYKNVTTHERIVNRCSTPISCHMASYKAKVISS